MTFLEWASYCTCLFVFIRTMHVIAVYQSEANIDDLYDNDFLVATNKQGQDRMRDTEVTIRSRTLYAKAWKGYFSNV